MNEEGGASLRQLPLFFEQTQENIRLVERFTSFETVDMLCFQAFCPDSKMLTRRC